MCIFVPTKTNIMNTIKSLHRAKNSRDLYTVIMKGDELVTAYYEDSNTKVFSPSLLHSLEYYLSTGLYKF